MNGTRATLAIVRRELDGHYLFVAVGVALLGFVIDDVAHAETLSGRFVVGAVALAFAVGRTFELDVANGTYFAAPLYGRQLARAHGVVGIVGALVFPLGVAIDWCARGTLANEFGPRGFALPLAFACAVAALVALSATLRAGGARLIYALMAAAGGAVTLAPSLAQLDDAPLAAFLLAAALGFLALRAFGETLARYDPI